MAAGRSIAGRGIPSTQAKVLEDNGTTPDAPVAEIAETMNYEFLGACFDDPNTPYLVKCKRCGRVRAERVSDIAWGCGCRVGGSRQSVPIKTELLSESKNKALTSWDWAQNDSELFSTLRTNSPKIVNWLCGNCGNSYKESVSQHMKRLSPELCQICIARGVALTNDDPLPRINFEMSTQFHPTKNGKIDVISLSPISKRQIWWIDPNCGYEWQDTPANRDRRFRIRCPKCDSVLDSLAYHYPELAAE